MTQGPYWDWLYKNGRIPQPTPDWGPGATQFYPPGQPQPTYLPQQLAGDPSGGMAWRNSLRGTPPMPWHYYPMPLQMQGGPTPYQSRPNFRNDYEPQDTTRQGSGYPQPTGKFDTGNPNPNPFWDWVYGRGTDYPPGVTPPGWPTNPTQSMTPLSSVGGKPRYSPARQSGTPPPNSTIGGQTVGAGSVLGAPSFSQPGVSAPAQTGPQPWERWQAAPPQPAANPGSNPASWDVPGEWGAPQTGASAAPNEWSLNDYVYNPDNPYAGVPWEYWGDPQLVAYINAQSARSSGGGGSNNYAFQNQFQQAEADRQAAQWNQSFQQTNDQWNQRMQMEQQRAARDAEQWQKEQERAKALDQWSQAFQQAQMDWNKTDAEARNRLTDQGQNLGAFNRRFGPNVGYF